MKLIRNVSLASGSSFKTVNVLFDDVIHQIGTSNIDNAEITEEYDFSGCFIMPGAVDMHTHILQGSAKDKDNLKRISKLALSGGFTTLADMAYLSTKPVLNKKDIAEIENLVKVNSFCDLAIWGHCDFSQFPYHLNQMYDLWSAGIIGFVIMQPSPNNDIETMSYDDIMDLFDSIYDSDISFAFQGFDIDEKSKSKSARDRFAEQRLGSIRKILRRLQDNPLHFVGIFDKDAIDILNNAYRRADLTYALPITELINYIDKFKIKGYTKDDPFSEFIKLLFDSMKNGKLYTISTEAGLRYETENEIMERAFSGYQENLLQWTVPWVFSELWKQKRVPIQSCIRMLSENPAKRVGLFPVKGCIQKGSDADILIINPEKPVKSDLLNPDGKNREFSCSVKATFLRGNLIYPEKKGQKAIGNLVKRSGTTRRKTSSSCWT